MMTKKFLRDSYDLRSQKKEDGMYPLNNWSGFYGLCQNEPDLIEGISENLHEVIMETILITDMFWSESME